MTRTSKNTMGGSSSRQKQNKTSNRTQSRSSSGSGRSENLRSASSNEAAMRDRGDSRGQGYSREERYGSPREGNRPLETGFHNEHYRAGFEAGRAYYHHYDRDFDRGDSQRRAGGSERWASDSNLNGPRDDYSRSSDRERDSDRFAGDYGESVYRSDNENYGAGQRGDGNLGRSREDLDENESDREYSGRSSSSTRNRGSDSSESRTGRGSRSRASSRSVKADDSES